MTQQSLNPAPQQPLGPTPVQPGSPEVTSDDKLWAALGYPTGIVALIMLLIESKRNRPFIKFHAVQALALAIVYIVVAIIIDILGAILARLTLGIGGLISCINPILWLLLFWPAFLAFQGKYFDIPVLTAFLRGQHWIS
jgi:uncharacterized membrane protein